MNLIRETVLVCVVVWSGVAGAAQQSDEELRRLIVGTWWLHMPGERTAPQKTIFGDDGSFKSIGFADKSCTRPGGTLSGTWKIENGRLSETAIEISPPSARSPSPGQVTTDEILSISPSEKLLRTERGILLRLTRGTDCPSEDARALQDDRPRYSLKQDGPATGSNIKRNAVGPSVIPMDKEYSELTPDQQRYVKSQYESMGPADEPPFPLGGLGSIFKAVSAAQKKLLVQGPLTMHVEIDSEGEPVSVSMYASPDPRMTQAVATILMLQKYKPARCNGQPCRMQFPFRTSFSVTL